MPRKGNGKVGYFRINGEKSPLEPILKKWAHLTLEYSESAEEPAFHFTEMANTSLLCAAAWKSKGWVGICEAQVSRISTHTSSNVGSTTGLVDLYLQDENLGYYIESKIVWPRMKYPSITSSNKAKSVTDAYEKAKSQLQSIDDDGQHIERHIAIFFVAEISKVHMNDDFCLPKRDPLIEFVKQQGCDFDEVCWAFPEIPEDGYPLSPNGNFFRPGVVLGLKKV